MHEQTLVIVAGDSGVYVGLMADFPDAVGSDGRVVLTRSRHLRRYYVVGRTGDGSVTDLAIRGLDPASPSVTDVLDGPIVLLGVRRVLAVAHSAGGFGVER